MKKILKRYGKIYGNRYGKIYGNKHGKIMGIDMKKILKKYETILNKHRKNTEKA